MNRDVIAQLAAAARAFTEKRAVSVGPLAHMLEPVFAHSAPVLEKGEQALAHTGSMLAHAGQPLAHGAEEIAHGAQAAEGAGARALGAGRPPVAGGVPQVPGPRLSGRPPVIPGGRRFAPPGIFPSPPPPVAPPSGPGFLRRNWRPFAVGGGTLAGAYGMGELYSAGRNRGWGQSDPEAFNRARDNFNNAQFVGTGEVDRLMMSGNPEDVTRANEIRQQLAEQTYNPNPWNPRLMGLNPFAAPSMEQQGNLAREIGARSHSQYEDMKKYMEERAATMKDPAEREKFVNSYADQMKDLNKRWEQSQAIPRVRQNMAGGPPTPGPSQRAPAYWGYNTRPGDPNNIGYQYLNWSQDYNQDPYANNVWSDITGQPGIIRGNQ
jgi:hypothetical protein